MQTEKEKRTSTKVLDNSADYGIIFLITRSKGERL